MLNKLTNLEKSIIGIGLLLFVFGLVAWGRILVGGAEAIGMSDLAPWGLFIALFLFLEAVGSGALFFGALHKSKTLLAIGVACVSGAGLAILPDIGAPMAIWRLFLAPNIGAPMVLDVWFVALNVAFGFTMLFALYKNNNELVKLVRPILFVTAILLPLGTAWMMTTMIGMPGWNSSLELFSFLLASAVAGSLLLYMMNEEAGRNGVIVTLVAATIIPLAELGHSMYSTSTSVSNMPHHALIDQYGGLFYGNWVLFIILPLVLVIMKQKPAVVAVLAFIGLMGSKYLLILQGNVLPYVQIGKFEIPGMQKFAGYVVNNYVPTMNELVVAVGMVGFTAALIVILVSFSRKDVAALS